MVRFKSLSTTIIGEGEKGCRPVTGEELIFRRDEWALRRTDGRCDRL